VLEDFYVANMADHWLKIRSLQAKSVAPGSQQDLYPVSPGGQLMNQIRSDKAGASGDETYLAHWLLVLLEPGC
jgi:hypothetical protein